MNNDKKRLEKILGKTETMVSVGNAIISKIEDLARKTQMAKVDMDLLLSASTTNRIQKRRYGSTEAAEIANISHTLLYTAEKDGRLPEPEFRKDTARKVRAGYTVNQINHIRKVMDTIPPKPNEDGAIISGILNLKGGSQKTTNCHQFSQYLAKKGHRVLILDTDPQGSLSFFYGKLPDINVSYINTIAPFLLEDDDSLIEAGFKPGAYKSLDYAIQKTYWDNIDIIPSCLENLHIDLLMPQMMKDSDVNPIDNLMKLRRGLVEVGKNYDYILIDGTPSLNISTLNVISACDVVCIPTPASMLDYASTVQFVNLIQETIVSYKDADIYPNIPDLHFFITKYSNRDFAKFMSKIIRRVFNIDPGDVLANEAEQSDEVGKASNAIYSIYEINPSEADNRKKLKATIQNFDELYGEMQTTINASLLKRFSNKLSPEEERSKLVEEKMSKIMDNFGREENSNKESLDQEYKEFIETNKESTNG